MSRFQKGQKVVCISTDFPLIQKYGGNGKEAKITPQKGEVLIIDEILGEFIRFDKYDSIDSWNWWKDDRFAPIDEIKEAIGSLISESKVS